jgi:hypothetical protein
MIVTTSREIAHSSVPMVTAGIAVSSAEVECSFINVIIAGRAGGGLVHGESTSTAHRLNAVDPRTRRIVTLVVLAVAVATVFIAAAVSG